MTGTPDDTLDPNEPLSLEQMADLVIACFGWPRGEVVDRLRREQACSGWNVVEEVLARGIEPFRWSAALADFYGSTRAFLYELLIYNAQPERIALRQTLLQLIADERRTRPGEPLQVLLWGDGLGFDSLAVAQAFPDVTVTYYEISRLSSRFAAFLCARGRQPGVRQVDRLEAADRARYHVVAAIDVLEHVPDPPAWVSELAAVVRPGGIAVIKEAFDAVIAARPTHLRASAVRYAYRTPRLFERAGFTTERYGNFPFVFRHTGQATPRLTRARVYYHVTTPVKRLLIVPRLMRRPDLRRFLRDCRSS